MAGRATTEFVSVEVRGLDQLDADWPRWERRTEFALQGCSVDMARLTADLTRMRVPVLTGRFRDSIRVVADEPANKPAARVTEGGGLEYARWLEFGRRKRSGPKRGGRYLLPTARRVKRQFKKRLAETTQREIETYPWPNPR